MENRTKGNNGQFLKGLLAGIALVGIIGFVIWVLGSPANKTKVKILSQEVIQDSTLMIRLTERSDSSKINVLINAVEAKKIGMQQDDVLFRVPDPKSMNSRNDSVTVVISSENNALVNTKLPLVGRVKKVAPRSPQRISLIDMVASSRWFSGILQPDSVSVMGLTSLSYPGAVTDANGYVRIDSVVMEDNSTEKVLRTHPKWADNGCIYGLFPIRGYNSRGVKGFSAAIGFVADLDTQTKSTDGVTFQVWINYQSQGAARREKLISVHKMNDGQLQMLSVRLPSYLPEDFTLELRVNAGSQSITDWAAWVNPKITLLFIPVFNQPL